MAKAAKEGQKDWPSFFLVNANAYANANANVNANADADANSSENDKNLEDLEAVENSELLRNFHASERALVFFLLGQQLCRCNKTLFIAHFLSAKLPATYGGGGDDDDEETKQRDPALEQFRFVPPATPPSATTCCFISSRPYLPRPAASANERLQLALLLFPNLKDRPR